MTLRTRKQVQTKMPVCIIIYNEVFINLASSAYIQRNNDSRYLSYRPSPKYRRSTRTLWYDILFIIFILKSCTDSNNLNSLKTTITGSSKFFCSAMGTTSMVSTYCICGSNETKSSNQKKTCSYYTFFRLWHFTALPVSRPLATQANKKHETSANKQTKAKLCMEFPAANQGGHYGQVPGFGAPAVLGVISQGPNQCLCQWPRACLIRPWVFHTLN